MAHGSPADFEASVRRFTERARAKAQRNLRRVCMKALSGIVIKTPVLTGCARGNWRVSFGEPVRLFDLSFNDSAGNRTISAGSSLIQGGARLGQRVNICNSAPYILRLERGYSRQAPAGMVHITADELVRGGDLRRL